MGTNWQVMEGLYELKMHNFEPYRALAAEEDPVQISDTEYEVSLREDAKFSDGTPVTSADVVESYKRATAEGNLYASMLDFIDDVTAKDDNTVTVHLSKPFSLVKERLTLIKIIPASMSQEELTAMPVGTGPWKYDSITEEKVTFSPNEHYNGEYPAEAKSLVVEVIKDDTARTTALQEGSVMVMEAVPADVRSQLEAAGATVESIQGFSLPFMMFNTKKAPFDDYRVRQAFFYALDVTVQKQVIDLLNELREKLGFAMIFVSHDLALVAEVAHGVTVMYAGQVVEQGPIQEVLMDPRHEYTRGLLGSVLSIEGGEGRLHQVPGTVPSPRDFPEGDRFAPRSSHPEAASTTRPTLVDVGNNHSYAVVLEEAHGTQTFEVEPADGGDKAEVTA